MLRKTFKRHIEPFEDELTRYTKECLNVKRWGGNPLLMLVDAGIVSTGINYFGVIVPKVKQFSHLGYRKFEEMVRLKKPRADMFSIYRNHRAWNLILECSRIFHSIDKNDRKALKKWARESDYLNWMENPIGKVKGVGINTFQYLRMQGGIDTSMPDKVVIRVLDRICNEAGYRFRANSPEGYIQEIEKLSDLTGYSPIELTWATWLIESDKPKKT